MKTRYAYVAGAVLAVALVIYVWRKRAAGNRANLDVAAGDAADAVSAPTKQGSAGVGGSKTVLGIGRGRGLTPAATPKSPTTNDAITLATKRAVAANPQATRIASLANAAISAYQTTNKKAS